MGRFSYRLATRTSRGRALLNFRESTDHTPIARSEHGCKSHHFRARIERWKAVLLRDPCVYCGRPATTIDHITPKCLRLPGEWPLWSDYTAACEKCNRTKADRSLLLFLLQGKRAPRAADFREAA